MKASDSDASEDDEANEFEFDYAEFFSVLMYYGHMSKEEIMNSSMPFLLGIFKQYSKRACENLGVSSDSDDEEINNTELKESDYPIEFRKLSADKEKELSKYESADDFLKQFSEYNPTKFNRR